MRFAGKYDEIQLQSLPYYPASNKIEGDCARLKKFIEKCKRGEDVTVVSIGGSVTQGQSASSSDLCYPPLIGKWIENRFNIKCNTVNAGSNGTGSVIGVERVWRDVLRHNPDLVVVEFSVNDGDNDLDMEAYESLILRLLTAEEAPAVIHLAMCNRQLGSSERIHAKICENYNVPLLSVKPFIEWVDDSAPYFKDGVHPVDPGFQVLANLVTMKLADVEANLDLIPDEEAPLAEKVTNAGMQDCRAIDVKDIEGLDFGDWFAEGYSTYCTTPDGKPLTIEADCSYILIKYEQSDKHNATIKIVVDGDEANAKTICNHGFYYNIVESFCMVKEPGHHKVEIYMTEGDRFQLSTAYLSNFVK